MRTQRLSPIWIANVLIWVGPTLHYHGECGNGGGAMDFRSEDDDLMDEDVDDGSPNPVIPWTETL